MPKYEVFVEYQEEPRRLTIVVEAEDEHHAEELAEEEADLILKKQNIDWEYLDAMAVSELSEGAA